MQAPHSYGQKAALLLAQEVSAMTFSDESVTTPGPSVHVTASIPEASYFLLDVVVDRRGRVRLIEANGSNAAGSSAHRFDLPRAQHLVATLLARRGEGGDPPLVVLGHQSGTPCLPEILSRAGIIASLLADVIGAPVDLVAAGTPLAAGHATVVTSPIDDLVKYVSVDHAKLLYLGEPVDIVSNANLAPALERQGHPDMELAVFHEGRAAEVVLDKAAQQRWAAEAGMLPLPNIEAATIDDAVGLTAGSPAAWFVKIRAGSGGTGVICIPPDTEPGRAFRLISDGLNKATEKYGSLSTAFPLGVFQFADTAPAMIDGYPYLWDLRVEVIVSRDGVIATPLSGRRCPAPFDGSYSAASVIVNLSGRKDGNSRVIDPVTLTDSLLFQEPKPSDLLRTMTVASAAWAIAVTKGCA